MVFDLVNVPVKLYSAAESHDVTMHQVHEKDGVRIRNQHRCQECGEVVESDDLKILRFVPNDRIDPIMLEKSYFLEPTSKTPKSYLLLRHTLEEGHVLNQAGFEHIRGEEEDGLARCVRLRRRDRPGTVCAGGPPLLSALPDRPGQSP